MPRQAPRTTRHLRSLVLLAMCCTPLGAGAGTRSHFEVYATTLTDDDASLQVWGRDSGGTPASRSANLSADASVEYGARGAVLIEGTPWLYGGDLGRFSTGGTCCMTLDVPSFAFFGGWQPRDPWLGKEGGGLRPYVLAGVAVPLIDGTAQINDLMVDVGGVSGSFSEVSPYLAAGLAWELTRQFGVVAEYRYRRFGFHDAQPNATPYEAENIEVEGTLDAGGISVGLRWNIPPGAGAP